MLFAKPLRRALTAFFALGVATGAQIACSSDSNEPPPFTDVQPAPSAKPTASAPGTSSATPTDASAPPTPQDASTRDAGPDNGTHGTGGPTGFRETTGAAGLKFQIDVPTTSPGNAPFGLLVLLHGSTASNYGTFVGMMKTVAAQYNLIRVSVLAPNGQGWNEGGNQAQVQAADKLHQLVQQDLFAKYDIDTTKVMFSGQSSGGGFLSTHFVPLHAKDYRGGVFLQCGAAPPAVGFAPDAATKAGFRMHFEITTGDGIWPQYYQQAVTAYTNAGMNLTKDASKPGGHCQFDQQQVILDHIKFVLALP